MLLVPVILAALLQALMWFALPIEFTPDSRLYQTNVESLLATGTASNALGEPDTVLTPGYPLFLAAFLASGLGYAGAVVAQHILWTLIVAATTWLTFRFTANTVAAIVAGLILAIDLPALQASHSVLTETLATVIVGLACWHAYRSIGITRAVWTGVLAGVAALIRPVAIVIAVPLGLAILIAGSQRPRLRIAIVIVAASLAVSSVWIFRNYAQTGVATYSSLGNINLLLYRAAGTLAIRDPGGVDANLGRRRAELEAAACRSAEAEFGRDCASLPVVLKSTVYRGLALPIIFGDPAATAMQASRAFAMILFGGGANMLAELTGVPESRLRLVAFAYTVPLAVLAAIGFFYWRKIDRLAAWTMLLTIAYLVFMSLGVEAYSRFRVPFLPLYAMLAGGGAAYCTEKFGARKN